MSDAFKVREQQDIPVESQDPGAVLNRNSSHVPSLHARSRGRGFVYKNSILRGQDEADEGLGHVRDQRGHLAERERAREGMRVWSNQGLDWTGGRLRPDS